ncbi:ABC transporter substrate-binding protein [Cochlodiniinecator piscidefendens]|uniref:ABC transporter substrate-binding protein n=1 Tax=Cochlodiniinecator piscidefendens TaxID=2715756 RepID=UPI00140C6DBB|nr:ABC transporter substrate-binding protein [Cochlodiniinecator piscidefendens]
MSKELDHYSNEVAKGRMSRRDFMGRATALGVSAVVAESMLATSAQASTPNKGGHFSMGISGGESTASLDPATVTNDVGQSAGRMTGDTLVNVNADGTIDPRLAESFEPSEGGLVWTFKIRQGVKFHNGNTMTVDDVVKTLQRHSNEDSQSGALGIMRGISTIEADGDSVKLTLTSANADLPYLMSDYHLVIQPDGGMNTPADGIGTGPYRITSEEPGVRYAFERFEDHWDPSVGHYDTAEILFINDETSRTAALQSGQVHFINRVPPRTAGLFNRAPNVEVRATAGKGHYVFIMHTDTAPFDNKDLRLALKYAINREEMVEKVLAGYGEIGNDLPVNETYPLFDTEIPQREHSLEMARQHYEASGHDGSPIILSASEVAFPGAMDAAALFQQSCQAAGIPLEIQREPSDGYWSEVWNVKPFCASYWGGRPVQDQMYSVAYLSSADWNDTRFSSPEFDALLIEARAELDLERRFELYSQMGYLLREDGGLINPMFNQFLDGTSANVAGWENDPNGSMMNGFVGVRTWFS